MPDGAPSRAEADHPPSMRGGGVDSVETPSPEAPRHCGDAVDADLPRHIVEIDVAGMLDPFEHVEDAVAALPLAIGDDIAQRQEFRARRHCSNSNIGDRSRSAIQRHVRVVAGETPAEIELKELWPGTS